MHYAYKMKTIYFSIITMMVIYVLLCPQPVSAENLPSAEKRPTEATLVSFKEYETAKRLEKELVETKTIDPFQGTEEKIDFKFETNDNGDILSVQITGEEYNITVVNDYKTVIYENTREIKAWAGEINEITEECKNDIGQTKEEMVQVIQKIQELSDVLKNKPGLKLYESMIRTLKTRLAELEDGTLRIYEAYAAERSMREKNISQLRSEIDKLASAFGSDSEDNNEDSDSTQYITEYSNSTSDTQYSVEIVALKKNMKIKPGSEPAKISDNTLQAAKNAQDDVRFDIALKVDNKESPKYIKIDNKSTQSSAIKKECAILSKAYAAASEKFDKAAAPYYERLASDLRKAHWLWQQQNIDPHIYYAGADSMLNEKEIRRMVEDGIAYLYKNVPDDAMQQAARNEILGVEKDLRAKYVGPALDIYHKELTEASRDFYRAVKNAVKPFINPFVNKTDNEIEVIISLPKATLK